MDSSAGARDDKWKLSNKGRSRSGRPHTMDAAATSSSSSSVLSRSYSASMSSSSSRSTSTTTAATCSSQPQSQQAQASSSSSSSSRLSKNKCVEAVKQHRARFYIVRRCVSMLVCWRDS